MTMTNNMLRTVLVFLGINLFLIHHFCVAGVSHMKSAWDITELEELVKASENQELQDEFNDVKILHEKALSLRQASMIDQANTLDKRIHNKLEKIHHEATRSESDFNPEDEEDKDEDKDPHEIERAERRDRMNKYAKKYSHLDLSDLDFRGDMEGGRDIDSRMRRDRDRHEHHMHDFMRRDVGRHAHDHDHKDIHERHQDLLDHRRQDFGKRLGIANFPPDKEAIIQEKIDAYIALEEEVMHSRMSDRSKEARAAHRKKSKEEREESREAMKMRRHAEKSKMEDARNMRKEIDNIIREQMSNVHTAELR